MRVKSMLESETKDTNKEDDWKRRNSGKLKIYPAGYTPLSMFLV